MSFIFRAYHAMARQRPMSTKTGIPTSATFVFVNMLRKLRADFAPQYLAAVFDVAAPTFRDEQATAIVSMRKFDSKTQTYVDKAYGGYKANRAADARRPGATDSLHPARARGLSHSHPRSCPASKPTTSSARWPARRPTQDYSVFVVSSDKDMMQLVSDRICVLNPPKDNLICDAAKVEEILGVPPEQGGRRDGPARRLHRQHSRRARHRRQGLGGADSALRQRGGRTGPCRRSRAQNLS